MMKTPRMAAALVLVAALFSGAAHAAHGSFTTTISNAGDGYVTGSFPEFSIVSSNNDSGPSLTQYGATFTTDETVTFNWSYTTSDDLGFYDPAGYYLGEDFYQLSANGAETGVTYSGTSTVFVAAGQTFGWYDYSADSDYGSSVLSVQVVPEPASLMLMLAGVGALGVVARRRKTA